MGINGVSGALQLFSGAYLEVSGAFVLGGLMAYQKVSGAYKWASGGFRGASRGGGFCRYALYTPTAIL